MLVITVISGGRGGEEGKGEESERERGREESLGRRESERGGEEREREKGGDERLGRGKEGERWREGEGSYMYITDQRGVQGTVRECVCMWRV